MRFLFVGEVRSPKKKKLGSIGRTLMFNWAATNKNRKYQHA
jgi:hypothetical protein